MRPFFPDIVSFNMWASLDGQRQSTLTCSHRGLGVVRAQMPEPSEKGISMNWGSFLWVRALLLRVYILGPLILGNSHIPNPHTQLQGHGKTKVLKAPAREETQTERGFPVLSWSAFHLHGGSRQKINKSTLLPGSVSRSLPKSVVSNKVSGQVILSRIMDQRGDLLPLLPYRWPLSLIPTQTPGGSIEVEPPSLGSCTPMV